MRDHFPSGWKKERYRASAGWTSRGYLPHFDAKDTWQAITYRLADAMPAHVVAALECELARHPEEERDEERRKRIERWVDSGSGSCLLRRNDVAALIAENWQHFASVRYDLGPWVIMPNHVHLLIRVDPAFPLKRIIASWKSHTAKEIMRATGSPAPIWWPDYWDRYIRDEAHWMSTKWYIENNPVTATWPLTQKPGIGAPHAAGENRS